MFLKALRGYGIGESLLSWNTIPPPPLSKGGGFEFLNFLQIGRVQIFLIKRGGGEVGKLWDLF